MRTFRLSLLCIVLASCGLESTSNLSDQTEDIGYVDIMPTETRDQYKALLPPIQDPVLHSIVHGSRTMWYDKSSIVPGYQDSAGDPEGMRPNTINSNLIDLAVPGGHARLFATRGRFNFPFGTGGADQSDNVHTINFWHAPTDAGQVLPVVYWRMNFSRWRWMFPVGTVLGEVLFVRYSDNELRIFEIRTRTRNQNGWDSKIFRPFRESEDLAQAIIEARPDWQQSSNLSNVVDHLRDSNRLTPHFLQARHYRGTFDRLDGHMDYLPDLGDMQLAKDLLKTTLFKDVETTEWAREGTKVSYAPSTRAGNSVVPRNYEGGMFPVTNEFCSKCHVDAGRQIWDFHDDLVLYGELWGEDRAFSWHLFETDMFVDSNGNVRNFNNDNRRLRRDFSEAGLVERYDPSRHPERTYKELPREWNFRPI